MLPWPSYVNKNLPKFEIISYTLNEISIETLFVANKSEIWNEKQTYR